MANEILPLLAEWQSLHDVSSIAELSHESVIGAGRLYRLDVTDRAASTPARKFSLVHPFLFQAPSKRHLQYYKFSASKIFLSPSQSTHVDKSSRPPCLQMDKCTSVLTVKNRAFRVCLDFYQRNRISRELHFPSGEVMWLGCRTTTVRSMLVVCKLLTITPPST